MNAKHTTKDLITQSLTLQHSKGFVRDAKHTPTPWKVADLNAWIEVRSNSTVRPICKIWKSDDDGKNEYQELQANAAHIVKCVNMHDELVECLRRLRMHCTDKYDAKQIDDLLLKAKGE